MLRTTFFVGVLTLVSYGSTQGRADYVDFTKFGQIDSFLSKRAKLQKNDYGVKRYIGDGEQATVYCDTAVCSSNSRVTMIVLNLKDLQACQRLSDYLETYYEKGVSRNDEMFWIKRGGFDYIDINCSNLLFQAFRQ